MCLCNIIALFLKLTHWLQNFLIKVMTGHSKTIYLRTGKFKRFCKVKPSKLSKKKHFQNGTKVSSKAIIYNE